MKKVLVKGYKRKDGVDVSEHLRGSDKNVSKLGSGLFDDLNEQIDRVNEQNKLSAKEKIGQAFGFTKIEVPGIGLVKTRTGMVERLKKGDREQMKEIVRLNQVNETPDLALAFVIGTDSRWDMWSILSSKETLTEAPEAYKAVLKTGAEKYFKLCEKVGSLSEKEADEMMEFVLFTSNDDLEMMVQDPELKPLATEKGINMILENHPALFYSQDTIRILKGFIKNLTK